MKQADWKTRPILIDVIGRIWMCIGYLQSWFSNEWTQADWKIRWSERRLDLGSTLIHRISLISFISILFRRFCLHTWSPHNYIYLLSYFRYQSSILNIFKVFCHQLQLVSNQTFSKILIYGVQETVLFFWKIHYC